MGCLKRKQNFSEIGCCSHQWTNKAFLLNVSLSHTINSKVEIGREGMPKLIWLLTIGMMINVTGISFIKEKRNRSNTPERLCLYPFGFGENT